MGWLDQFFHGYETILNAGQLLLARAKINLVAPLTATDDETNKWTSISISAASSTAAGTQSADDYKKLADLAPGSTYAPRVPVTQPALAATGTVGVVIACAGASGSSLISSVAFISPQPVTVDATNYRTCTIYDIDAAGAGVSVHVETATPSGTGNWTAAQVAFSWEPVGGYVLLTGHMLAASWTSTAAGLAIPICAWRVT